MSDKSEKCVWIEKTKSPCIRERMYKHLSCEKKPDNIDDFWWPYSIKGLKKECPYCGKEIEVRDE